MRKINIVSKQRGKRFFWKQKNTGNVYLLEKMKSFQSRRMKHGRLSNFYLG